MLHTVALMLLLAGSSSSMPMGSHGRYYGAPDLAVTSAMLAAGGGADRFDSRKLFTYLTGKLAASESRALIQRYGATNVTQFFTTFDSFVARAVKEVRRQDAILPTPPPELGNGRALSRAMYAEGVMADSRFDVGYMLEHLLSRKMHKVLMDEVNADPAFGSQKNAEFHVILTKAMGDLHTAYAT